VSKVEKLVAKKSKGIKHQASDANPKPNKKKKQLRNFYSLLMFFLTYFNSLLIADLQKIATR
jgi:hypothetical protein